MLRIRVPGLLVAACLALAAMLWSGGAEAASRRSKMPKIEVPLGLAEVKVRGFRRSFVRHEADLATPRPVCLGAGELSLSPELPRKVYGRPLQPYEIERIQRDINRAVMSEFEKAFRNQGGFQLTTDPSKCGMRLVVSVQDLYLNAPEPLAAGTTRTYARSVGHMRMKIDVLDPSGGILLAQAHGFREDPVRNWLVGNDSLLDENNRITPLDNVEFARETARLFAEYTRTRLLIAHPR